MFMLGEMRGGRGGAIQSKAIVVFRLNVLAMGVHL